MEIQIKNINNIRNFSHKFTNNKVNVICGENGLGKSSIAKALSSKEDEIEKFKSLYEWGDPYVSKPNNFRYELFSDETFKIDFIENDIKSNSYDLIFKNEDIIELEEHINMLLSDIKEFVKLSKFEDTKSTVEDFMKIFKLNRSKTINQTPKVKSIKIYEPIKISELNMNHATVYRSLDKKVDWLSWINQGKTFSTEGICPYCSQIIQEKEERKINEIISRVQIRDLKNIEDINKVTENLSSKVNFNKKLFDNITSRRWNIEAKSYNKQIVSEIKKIEKIQDVFNKLMKVSRNEHQDDLVKINISNITSFKDEEFDEKFIDLINDFNTKIRMIQGKKRRLTNRLIEKVEIYNELINEFLKTSGINFNINFVKENEKAITLEYNFKNTYSKAKIKLDNISNKLSFGEEKIITVLFFLLNKTSNDKTVFMFDDPTTLFDRNKRYAFLNLIKTLKRKKRNKSEKFIKNSDVVIILTHSFDALKESITSEETVNYIAHNIEGELTLKEVDYKTLASYYKNINEMIKSTNNVLVKLILYRNLIQSDYIKDPQNKKYNYISSISKFRKPSTKDNSKVYDQKDNTTTLSLMNEDGIFNINRAELIANLNVKNIIELFGTELLWFEKVILFRIVSDYFKHNNKNDLVSRRFVTALFHVENDYLFNVSFQLHQQVPHYVLNLIDIIIEEFRTLEIEEPINDFSLIL